MQLTQAILNFFTRFPLGKSIFKSSSVFLFSIKSERALGNFDFSYHCNLDWVEADVRQRTSFPFWGIKKIPHKCSKLYEDTSRSSTESILDIINSTGRLFEMNESPIKCQENLAYEDDGRPTSLKSFQLKETWIKQRNQAIQAMIITSHAKNWTVGERNLLKDQIAPCSSWLSLCA